MSAHLSEFVEMVFPEHGGIVYVLCFIPPNADSSIPFYVGESSRHIGRFGDYVSAKFSASTDFKVGEAIKHLRSMKLEVTIKYLLCDDRKEREKLLLQKLMTEGYLLLNQLGNYNYRIANEATERHKIGIFMQQLVETNPIAHASANPSQAGLAKASPLIQTLAIA